ncbi:MAG: Unknown protein [uncultured Sulfurovum sp.]|uniref:Periplasmic protein n=1 Tax=uncultured Sulfurovum sp. TaxID=269237 RepID=A0A6S6U0R4_9BACT|nr:MAG: Unknown protein [uncultured Sulfurovum sp.]
MLAIFRFLLLVVVLIQSTLHASQSEYVYTYVPKQVYSNQLFPVTLVGPDESPTLIFDRSSMVQPLFKKPLIVKNGQQNFYTFYFKAEYSDMTLPMLFISSETTETSLSDRKIEHMPLKVPENFSGVLASSMKIKNHQVSNFDGENHMVTLSLEAYEANLEDMLVKGVLEGDIESFHRKHAKVTAGYYAVLPNDKEALTFTYFNTTRRAFKTLSVPVHVVNASVTTQSDLNPKVDAFERLKKYTLIGFVLFFLLMFLLRRDFFYLVLGVISIITLLTFYIPHKKICISQGTEVYILPTHTSTSSSRIHSTMDAMLLDTHGDFLKIEYKTGLIGWVKNENTCKN